MYAGGYSMTAIHRREMFRILLGGSIVATAGLALMPVPAESAPLTMSKSLAALPAPTENLVEEAVVVVRRRHWVGPRRHWVGHRRHWVGHRRHWVGRRRRWVCWWRHG